MSRSQGLQQLAQRDPARVPWLPTRAMRAAPDAPIVLGVLPIAVACFAVSIALPLRDARPVQTALCDTVSATVMIALWLRLLRRSCDRAAWGVLALGMTAWCLATVWGDLRMFPVMPITMTDVFWMSLYLAGLANIALLRRRRLSGIGSSALIDGLICACGAGAVSIPAWLLPLAERSTQNLRDLLAYSAYPLLGMTILGLLLTISLSHSGRVAPTWRLLASGWFCMFVADSLFVWQQAIGAYRWADVPNLFYLAGISLICLAAWADDSVRLSRSPSAVLLWLSSAGGLACTAVLVLAATTRIDRAATLLAAVGLVLVGMRTRRAFADVLALADSQREAWTDPLTGLHNRRYFFRSAGHALDRRPGAQGLTLLLLDLDRFKEVNDTFGHRSGDEVLTAIAQRMASVLGENDLLARLGGDEFAVIVEGDIERAADAAHLLALAIGEPLTIHGVPIYVTVSIGAACWPADGDSPEVLLARADMAMYVAKRRHHPVQFFEPAMEAAIRGRVRSQSLLRAALQERTTPDHGERRSQNSLRMLYQPQVALCSGRMCGVEALMRWDPDLIGPISPEVFVAMAEDTGLIKPLTRFALATAISQAAAWRADGFDTQVAVNLSPTNLSEPDLVATISALLRRFELPASSLRVELTEDALLEDFDLAVDALSHLAGIGVSASLDDFGTGRSSLSYLRRLPVAELKLDRSLIRDVVHDATSRSIVGAAVDVGHALGLVVVAEGVEDAPTASVLRTLDVDRAQGFLFARPMPGCEIRAWCNRRDIMTSHEPAGAESPGRVTGRRLGVTSH